jgi:hypothetical protein
MIAFKTIRKRAAVLSLTLMAAAVAHAQGSTTANASTDIYTTDFQRTFATDRAASEGAAASVGTGSTDIYRADFRTAFATNGSVGKPRDTASYKGSTDIYSNDFQKSLM